MKKTLLLLIVLSLCGTALCQSSDLIAKGQNAEKLDLLDRAQSYYEQAVAAEPDNAIPLLMLGKLQEKRAHLDEAIVSLYQATTINDTLAEAYEHLVYCLIENNDFEGIRCGLISSVDQLQQLTERAIELNPQSASAYCSMALIYNYKKNFTNAINWVKCHQLGKEGSRDRP